MSDPNMKVSDILGTGPTLEPLNAPEPFDPAKCDPFVLVAANTELAAENEALRSTLAELVEAGKARVNTADVRHAEIWQAAQNRYKAAIAAAKSLLDDSKGEA